MLEIYTTYFNGTAFIRIYKGDTLMEQYSRPFATEAEALNWFCQRGVDQIENLPVFLEYLKTKGTWGRQLSQMIQSEGRVYLDQLLAVLTVHRGEFYANRGCQILSKEMFSTF